jgi:hypothetical protein
MQGLKAVVVRHPADSFDNVERQLNEAGEILQIWRLKAAFR